MIDYCSRDRNEILLYYLKGIPGEADIYGRSVLLSLYYFLKADERSEDYAGQLLLEQIVSGWVSPRADVSLDLDKDAVTEAVFHFLRSRLAPSWQYCPDVFPMLHEKPGGYRERRAFNCCHALHAELRRRTVFRNR